MAEEGALWGGTAAFFVIALVLVAALGFAGCAGLVPASHFQCVVVQFPLTHSSLPLRPRLPHLQNQRYPDMFGCYMHVVDVVLHLAVPVAPPHCPQTRAVMVTLQ